MIDSTSSSRMFPSRTNRKVRRRAALALGVTAIVAVGATVGSAGASPLRGGDRPDELRALPLAADDTTEDAVATNRFGKTPDLPGLSGEPRRFPPRLNPPEPRPYPPLPPPFELPKRPKLPFKPRPPMPKINCQTRVDTNEDTFSETLVVDFDCDGTPEEWHVDEDRDGDVDLIFTADETGRIVQVERIDNASSQGCSVGPPRDDSDLGRESTCAEKDRLPPPAVSPPGCEPQRVADPLVESVDFNCDGREDQWSVDLDGDGDVDIVFRGDGLADQAWGR